MTDVTATDRSLEPSKVGGRLREERERRGVSLRELARRVRLRTIVGEAKPSELSTSGRT